MAYKDPEKAKSYYREYYRKNKVKKASQEKQRYANKRDELLEQKRE